MGSFFFFFLFAVVFLRLLHHVWGNDDSIYSLILSHKMMNVNFTRFLFWNKKWRTIAFLRCIQRVEHTRRLLNRFYSFKLAYSEDFNYLKSSNCLAGVLPHEMQWPDWRAKLGTPSRIKMSEWKYSWDSSGVTEWRRGGGAFLTRQPADCW